MLRLHKCRSVKALLENVSVDCSGEVQALHPSLLAEHQGTLSRNQRPGRGDLRSWNAPQTVANVPIGRQSMYRMGRDVASDSTYWLSWASVVHVVRGFDTGDTTERTYRWNR